MYPGKEEAQHLLREAEALNPGPWGNHSRTCAHCAERIASLSGMNPEKAYVLGLLHDIGRRFGKRHLGHVSDGYSYMMSLGYDEVARVCLTHSFNGGTIEGYVGNFDTSEEETELIKKELARTQLDDDSDGYIIHALNTVYISGLHKWIRLDARGNKSGVNAQFCIGYEMLAFPIRVQYDEIDYKDNNPDLDERLIKILDEAESVLDIRTDFDLS